jgi:rubrerythrin
VRAPERLGPAEFKGGYLVRRVLREPEPPVACPECGTTLEDQITFRSCPKCEHCEEKR